ncbi:unnamed protein product [Caretta caretta]
MDCGSRFFYALEKTRGAKKHVTCLLAEDGTPLMEPVEIVLWEEIPMVSVSDRDRLQLPLTLAKFSEALRRMPTNKSPGMDGLTVDFYRVFWDDQEKAFDRVDHGYRLSTLRSFGFGPQFVGFLRVLYASGECLVKLIWTLTEPINFGRAVERLTGLVLREPELQLVLSAYADDVLLVVQDPGDLVRVEACQAIYSAASSAWVNWVKISGLAAYEERQKPCQWELTKIDQVSEAG